MRNARPRRTRCAARVCAAIAATAAILNPSPGRGVEPRKPALAGTWYPASRARLVSAAHFLMRLADTAPTPASKPLVLVVPHAGWNYSGLAAAAAYRLLHHGDFDRVVVVAPSHRGRFRGYALADTPAYETPLGTVPVCPGTSEALEGEAARPVPGVSGPEHAIEVELPFLQVALGPFCLVPVLVGDAGPDLEAAFAQRLSRLDDGRTLFVFSSDFVHYGPRYDFTPYGALSPATLEWIREQDRRAIAHIERQDAPSFRSFLERTHATICGGQGLLTLVKLLPLVAPEAEPTLLAHYLSAELPSAQDDTSVSYVALSFARSAPLAEPGGTRHRPPAALPLTTVPSLEAASAGTPPLSAEEGARLVRLARASLLSELEGSVDLDRELTAWPRGPGDRVRQGVFVSLYERDGSTEGPRRPMRGCVGQAEPLVPLYYGTVQAALDAALHDARFASVRASELDRLQVEVTVLSPRREVASWREIRLGTDGIVLQKGDQTALFLPQTAAAFATLEDALSALARKAGLPPDAWRTDARLSVFRGQIFAEDP